MAEQDVTLKELRELPISELDVKEAGLRDQLWKEKMKGRTGALQMTHTPKKIRRQIARVATMRREKELAEKVKQKQNKVTTHE